MKSWKELIEQMFSYNGDTWEDVVSHTFTGEEMTEMFDTSYGGPEGVPFTLWTDKYVYFPTEYDGAEGVSYVSRSPNGKPTSHI